MNSVYMKEAVEIIEPGLHTSKIRYLNRDIEPFWVKNERLKSTKPSKLERWKNKLRARLAVIENSPVSYYVAAHIASTPSRYNVSYPPGKLGEVTDFCMKYGIEVPNHCLTQSSEKTIGWSCSVVCPELPEDIVKSLENETGTLATRYFNTPNRSIQAQDFVLGFLGGTLGFKLGEPQDIDSIRARVPNQFLPNFDSGVIPVDKPSPVC